MKLISMTDFVLSDQVKSTLEYSDAYKLIRNYALFLKQPLTLGMFVPCDEEGNVLEFIEYESFRGSDDEYNIYCEKYFKSESVVLFEGFYYQSNFSKKQNKLYEYVRNKHPHVFSFEQIKNSTVEALLTGYKKEFLITLTEAAIKQIGL